MIVLFPLTNILIIVFSTAILMISVYSKFHTYYTSALPVWSNWVLLMIAIFIFFLGSFGYYSGTKGHYNLLIIYIILIAISSFVCLLTGIAMIVMTGNVKKSIAMDWYKIYPKLKANCYDITESTFSNFTEINLKFAGLFVIVFCLFLIVALFPAIYISITIKQKRFIQTSIG
jgi:hypothetical protein